MEVGLIEGMEEVMLVSIYALIAGIVKQNSSGSCDHG